MAHKANLAKQAKPCDGNAEAAATQHDPVTCATHPAQYDASGCCISHAFTPMPLDAQFFNTQADRCDSAANAAAGPSPSTG